MKKRVMTMVAACAIALGGWAQYGEAIQFPTADLYDSGVMNMYARALAETAARREEIFEGYQELALQAFEEKRWYKVIDYVDAALRSQYYNGQVYYLRGSAYEALGNWKQAKKDYRKGSKNGYYLAKIALNSLNEKMRQQRKK